MMNKQHKIVGVAAAHRELDGTQSEGTPAQIVKAGKQFGWRIVDLRTWQYELPDDLRLDGLLLSTYHENRETIQRVVSKADFGVSIGHNHGISELSVIEADCSAIGTRVAQYFLDRGYRNLSTCSFYSTSSHQALDTFTEKARSIGAFCSHIHINPGGTGVTLDEQFLCFKSQVLQLPLPQAVFCRNDRLAARVCQWCLDLELAVPEQVVIMGAGNDPMICECSRVPLSSIALTSNNMGTEAAKLLQNIMNGNVDPPVHFMMPAGEIITRRSSDMLAVPNLACAKASRFIEDHYTEDIGLNDIAKACVVSRRTLTSSFKAHLGETINAHINNRRIAKACELLIQTEQPAIDIAAQTGFRSAQSFSRKFTQLLNMTPQEYRKNDRKNRVMNT